MEMNGLAPGAFAGSMEQNAEITRTEQNYNEMFDIITKSCVLLQDDNHPSQSG